MMQDLLILILIIPLRHNGCSNSLQSFTESTYETGKTSVLIETCTQLTPTEGAVVSNIFPLSKNTIQGYKKGYY